MGSDVLSKPPSLTQLFDAPEDFGGIFGVVCGYSADSEFLDNALERFSRHTRAQRAYEGRISLLLMLDPAHQQISFVDVPGLYHIPLRSDVDKPFRLMHAKVAVLGFRHLKDAEKWRLRLIVSTGNWTRQTLEDSLDLAWHIEIDSEQLTRRTDDEVSQKCADLRAAWELLDFLQQFYTVSLAHYGEYEQLKQWVALVGRRSKQPAPRFIDNRRKSFLAQIPRSVKSVISGKVPNYLAMGSGFYEGSDGQPGIPGVLRDIVKALRDEKCLTETSDVDVYVNPQACQAVASGFNELCAEGWSIKKPSQLSCFGNAERSLHAKFLFSAYARSDSDRCINPWVYLGSGNLTGPGFRQPTSSAGNLEAGVLFCPDELYWYEPKGVCAEKWVSNHLPVHWGESITSSGGVSTGGKMPPRAQEFLSAPVAWFVWESDAQSAWGWLKADTEPSSAFGVVDSEGSLSEFHPETGLYWRASRPRQVDLRWRRGSEDYTALVPVVDELGRVAATELPELDLDLAWLQLLAFPQPPEDEDLDGGEESDGAEVDDKTGIPAGASSLEVGTITHQPIRVMMEFIENIAQKQTALDPADWPYWCARLEQTLIQASGSDVVTQFQSLGLDPLYPLKEAPFRPDFSMTDEKLSRQYEALLDRVAAKWGVSGLQPLGGVF